MASIRKRLLRQRKGETRKRYRWYVDYYDQGGVRRWLKCTTEAEAKRLRHEKEEEPGGNPHISFADICTEWLHIAKATVKPQTYRGYAKFTRLHLLPELGHQRIRQLKKIQLKRFLAEKLTSGLSRNTVLGLHSMLSGIFRLAMDGDVVTKNPVLGLGRELNLHQRQRHGDQVRAFTPEQLSRFLLSAKAIQPRFYPLYLTMARTGMRVSETTGLKWSDIDWEKRTIYVQRSMDGRREDTPKTERSVRHVDMSRGLTEVLSRLKTQRDEERLRGLWRRFPPYVFVMKLGTVAMPPYIGTSIKKVLKHAGLPSYFSAHAFRHTFAATHIKILKTNIQYVCDQLGHSSIAMTHQVYGDWFPIVERGAADRLDELGKGEA